MSDDLPFMVAQNKGLSEQISGRDDLLHPEQNSQVTADSLTETQYFGFSVPEEGIHGYAYLWHHPNLKMLSGGLWSWRGIKQQIVQCELCDYRTYVNDSALNNDLHDYRLENGYGVKILEPLKRFHMTYNDPLRENSVDLIYEAITPPVMYGDGKHFEQPMRCTGELVLRGQRYDVNCYTVRDRSWAKPRPEDNMTLPSVSWMTGVFNDNFAFNCNVLDQASGNPELTGKFALSDEDALKGGWVYRDGQVGRIVSVQKIVKRAPRTLLPEHMDLRVTDELDRNFHIQGALISSCSWLAWGNIYSDVSLMRWECDGQVAYGDCQSGIWNDYYNYMANL